MSRLCALGVTILLLAVPLSLGASLPGFRFDRCTGGFVRQAFRALTFFIARSGRLDGQITRVEIYRIGYIDC